MKKLFSFLLTLVSVVAFANDGVYYTSGNQLIPLQETDISVKKEILTISILDDGFAKVDVYYEFYNPDSQSKTVQMGFEADMPYNSDYDEFDGSAEHPNIKEFTVDVNGERKAYSNAVCWQNLKNLKDGLVDLNKWEYNNEIYRFITKGKSLDDNDTEYADISFVYYFDATFKPGVNKIHHTYQYEMSVVVGTQYLIDYKLSPAARWANGQIDDFTLIVRADNTAKYFNVHQGSFPESAQFTCIEGKAKIRKFKTDFTEGYSVSLRNGAVKLHLTNFKPEDGKELNINSADEHITFADTCRFGDYYDRNNVVALYTWKYSEELRAKISNSMMKRIARNLPYANRGHVFKDPTLKKYFESLWWYMPDPSYKDDTSDFTEKDWEHVNFDPEAE